MVYVHIPYCRSKCLYCDFYSTVASRASWESLVSSLLREAGTRLPAEPGNTPGSPHTLYIGGGTPSLLPEMEFRRLAGGLLKLMPAPEEFTIEVNPDDVTDAKAALWRECGVNRVSMGVQSLVNTELKAIGRRHDCARAYSAYDTLRRHFANVSLDLMFGLPGQTTVSLSKTLAGFSAMAPEHISAYSLMYEERSALTRLRDSGRIRETPEDESERMFGLVNETLFRAGYAQYEISNYALPGMESRHNSAYWSGAAYIGLGPGAHSYDGRRTRRANLPDIKKYLENPIIHFETETLTDNELREEMIMTRLRTREGICLKDFSSRFGEASLRVLRENATTFVKQGILRLTRDSLSLTRRGVMVSDAVIAALF